MHCVATHVRKLHRYMFYNMPCGLPVTCMQMQLHPRVNKWTFLITATFLCNNIRTCSFQCITPGVWVGRFIIWEVWYNEIMSLCGAIQLSKRVPAVFSIRIWNVSFASSFWQSQTRSWWSRTFNSLELLIQIKYKKKLWIFFLSDCCVLLS